MTLKTKLLAASAFFMLYFFIGIFHNGSRCSFGEQNRVISKYKKNSYPIPNFLILLYSLRVEGFI